MMIFLFIYVAARFFSVSWLHVFKVKIVFVMLFTVYNSPVLILKLIFVENSMLHNRSLC